MSWKTGKGGGSSKRGWSGGGSAREAPVHRWQDTTAAAENKRIRRRRHRNRWAVVSALGLGLLACLIWLYLQTKPWSTLVIYTATDYAAPVPINAWVAEDVHSLQKLHRHNLLVDDESDKLQNTSSPRVNFDREVTKGARRTPVIFYFNMHGVVNGAREPCLLPAQASMRDPDKWLRVADVLAGAREAVPAAQNVLVILDANRIRTDWSLGILSNTFAERVKELVESKRNELPGLAVILAADAGEVSWISAELGGSVFGHYLQLGLAGDKDPGGGSFLTGADVTLHELADYLRREVSAWARSNRGESQTPVLIPADAADFHIAYKNRSLNRIIEGAKAPHAALLPSDETISKIEKLWQKLDTLRNEYELLRIDPIACYKFEAALLRIENLYHGGAVDVKTADDVLKNLTKDLDDAFNRTQSMAGSKFLALADQLAITSPAEASWARIPAGSHTLPTGEYFGGINADKSGQIKNLWARLQAPGSDQSITQIIPERDLAWQLSETQFLAAIKQQQVSARWEKRDAVMSVVNTRLPQDTTKPNDFGAEDIAVPRHRNGAPGDERAHYYARSVAEIADKVRRNAEDALFVGERNAPKQDYNGIARKLYQSARNVQMEEAALAFQTTDRCCSEIPYLAAWVCSPLSNRLADRNDIVNKKLLPLIKNAADLNEKVNQQIPLYRGDSSPEQLAQRTKQALDTARHLPFRSLAASVLEELDTSKQGLRHLFDVECDKCLEDEPFDASDWRAVDAALTVPLIHSKKRIQLLKRRNDIAKSLNEKYHSVDDTPRASELEFREAMKTWSSHPLLAILQLPVPTDDKQSPAWYEAASDNALSWKLPDYGHNWAKLEPPENSQKEVLQERLKLSCKERAARISSFFGINADEERSAAVGELRKFDVQQLLVWHSNRAIDDFWGTVPNGPTDSPFFQRAASDYLNSAKAVRESTPPAIRDQLEQIGHLLEQRLAAKRANVKVTATSPLELDPTKPVNVSLTVEMADIGDYPDGIAAVLLSDRVGPQARLLVRPKPSGNGGFLKFASTRTDRNEFDVEIPTDVDLKDPLNASAYFRGREVDSRFQLNRFGGVEIAYVPHRYTNQSITLSGDRDQRSSIMFILDCSKSMEASGVTKREGAAVAGQETRLHVAIDQLNSMLDGLAQRSDRGEQIHAGLFLFGHRRSHQYDANRRISGQDVSSDYAKASALPAGLTPSRDVEYVHSLGRLTVNDATDVEKLLKKVKPWGETPLWLSLHQALAAFRNEEVGAHAAIVAITDGDNHQSQPDTFPQDVIVAARALKKCIPIYILGFQIETAAEKENLKQSCKSIADATGCICEYTSVETGTELLKTLEEQLLRDTYMLRSIAQLSAAREFEVEKQLNEAIDVPDVERSPKKLEVAYRSAMPHAVWFEGGEALQMSLEQRGAAPIIVAAPYDQYPAYKDQLTSNSGISEFELRVTPKRDANEVVFTVSLQRKRKGSSSYDFTPRPAETWLEVTPMADSTPIGDSYIFYDKNYEPKTPVPVLRWTAQSWPENATSARIRFWCKPYPTKPDEVVLLSELSESPRVTNSLSLSAGVLTENGVPCVQITEDRSQALGVSLHKILLESAVQPRRVVRKFDEKNRVAVHAFYFEKPTDFRGAQVAITNSDHIKESALRIADDVDVIIPINPRESVFRPTAGASSP